MTRRAILILGDQLDLEAELLQKSDPAQDLIVMTEAWEEATYLRQHKKRLVLFFAAMRHFAEALRERGWHVRYTKIDDDAPAESLADAASCIDAHEFHVTQPGDWRVLQSLRNGLSDLVIHEDRHFLCSLDDFAAWREGRKRVVLEDFYRMMRKRTGWLMDGDQPIGGRWNFDKDNRESFGKDGPRDTPGRPESRPDEITQTVMETVERVFPDAPGTAQGFAEPVTRRQALAHLRDFIENRLADFGTHQDAMAKDQATLWHSRLSAALNLKLLDPREVCAAAIEAYHAGGAPLNSVEGFVRQILGWREFVRGIYWHEMPGYADLNELGADRGLPAFFWTGDTEMACLSDCLNQLIDTGYAHHIQRLMVMGLFAMLWGAHPYRVHEWHMELYLDAVDWVSLPNVLGMSQHGDGGIVGTKPYAASGAYINRMSSYCRDCAYDPKNATGETGCPFTTLYWDFLAEHQTELRKNRRMTMQIRNLDRKPDDEVAAIRRAAKDLRERLGAA